MELVAHCQRYQGWWIVRVPAVKGLHTQVRRLDQVEAMVKDAASLLLERPEGDFDITVVPELDEADTASVTSAKEARARLQEAQDEAAQANRAIVARLAAQGLTVRDIGAILDVSPQRAQQLLKAA